MASSTIKIYRRTDSDPRKCCFVSATKEHEENLQFNFHPNIGQMSRNGQFSSDNNKKFKLKNSTTRQTINNNGNSYRTSKPQC